MVSVPCKESDNGYAKYTVSSKDVFRRKENDAYHVNVNLGPADNMIPVKMLKDKKFQEVLIKASDFAQMQDAAVKQYKKQREQRVNATVQKLEITAPQNEDEMVLQ